MDITHTTLYTSQYDVTKKGPSPVGHTHTHTHTHTHPKTQKLDPSLIKSLPRWLNDAEPAHQAGDAGSISWSEDPLENSPSIFAWKIPLRELILR